MRVTALVLGALALAACSQESDDAASNDAAANSAAAPAPAQQGSADSPSFDCARADGQAQELVCSDPQLATMDRELARLYNLAEADPQLPAQGLNELKATQRGWVKGRDDCWKADDLRQCVVTNYAERIHRLRQGSAAARAEAPQAISIGPIAFRCEGLGAVVAATFINANPGSVFVEWGPNDQYVLPQAMSGSGARYAGKVDGGEMVFWNKGREATLIMPGKPDYNCSEEETG